MRRRKSSDEGLTDGEWTIHLSLEEPIGSMLIAKVDVFSDSVFSTDPGALDLLSASKMLEKKAGAVMKSDSCKDRNDIAGQSIDIEWHVCDTSVQLLKKLKACVGDQDTNLRVFQTR